MCWAGSRLVSFSIPYTYIGFGPKWCVDCFILFGVGLRVEACGIVCVRCVKVKNKNKNNWSCWDLSCCNTGYVSWQEKQSASSLLSSSLSLSSGGSLLLFIIFYFFKYYIKLYWWWQGCSWRTLISCYSWENCGEGGINGEIPWWPWWDGHQNYHGGWWWY